jgi:hypothetical protein
MSAKKKQIKEIGTSVVICHEEEEEGSTCDLYTDGQIVHSVVETKT